MLLRHATPPSFVCLIIAPPIDAAMLLSPRCFIAVFAMARWRVLLLRGICGVDTARAGGSERGVLRQQRSARCATCYGKMIIIIAQQ